MKRLLLFLAVATFSVSSVFAAAHIYKGNSTYTYDILLTTDAPIPMPILMYAM